MAAFSLISRSTRWLVRMFLRMRSDGGSWSIEALKRQGCHRCLVALLKLHYNLAWYLRSRKVGVGQRCSMYMVYLSCSPLQLVM